MRFPIAQHPGELSPAVLAKYAQTFDKFSGGHLLPLLDLDHGFEGPALASRPARVA